MVIQLLIPQSFSYKEKYEKEGAFPQIFLDVRGRIYEIDKYMNRIRAEVRTFAIHDGNCVIINRYTGYAGLEGMSLYQNYANGSIRRTDALVCHA